MRWFVVLLLLSNVILFFWVQQESLNASRHSSIPPPDIGRLRLLKEGQEIKDEAPTSPAIADLQRPARQAEEQTPQSADETSDVSSQALPVETPPDEPEVAAVEEAIAEESPGMASKIAAEAANEKPAFSVLSDAFSRLTESFTSNDEAIVADAADVASVTSDEAVEAVSAPDQVESETITQPESAPQDVTAAQVTDAAETGADANEPVVVDESCARVGPLKPADADRLLAGLPGHIELLSDTSTEQQIVTDYYALILPLPSRAEGRKTVRELNAAGFKDTWLFQRGEYRNAISLGVFSQKRGAQRQAALAAKKGFAAVVRDKTTTAARRWLELRTHGEGDLVGALPLPKGIGLTPQSCP